MGDTGHRQTTLAVTTRAAAAQIGAVVAASAIAFAAELRFADALPWGSEARGVAAVLVGALLALWLHRRAGQPWAGLGFRRPRRWSTVPGWVIGIVVVFIVAQNAVPLLIAQFASLPEPDMSRYAGVAGNARAAILLLLLLPLTASIPEEIVYRGFLLPRFERLLSAGGLSAGGSARRSAIAAAVGAVLLQALVFGLVHFQWGPGGILMTTIMGLVWGSAYVLCGRNLWIVILAHSLVHILFVMQLYSAAG